MQGKAGILGLVVAAFVASMAMASSASADAKFAPDSGPNPLQVLVNDQLGCQLFRGSEFIHQFDSGSSESHNYCGTFIGFADGTTYGDTTAADGIGNPYTIDKPNQTTGGSGTAADPYTITTVVHVVEPKDLTRHEALQPAAFPAGTQLLTLTEVDSYVSGDDFYRTDVTVHNDTTGTLNPVLYHAGDCGLEGDDFGLAERDSLAGPVFCTPNVPVDDGGGDGESPITDAVSTIDDPAILGLIPVGTDSTYIEASDNDTDEDDSELNDAIDGTPFAGNRCDDCAKDPGTDEPADNGVGLSWALSLPGGGDARRCFYTVQSQDGTTPDVPSSCTPAAKPPATIAQQAPPTCSLRISRARLFLFSRHPRLRLVARYRTAAPADVKINFKAVQNGNKVDLGEVTRHFSGHGLFRLPQQITEEQSNSLFDTPKFIVHFKIPGEPGFCERKYTKTLTVPRIIDGQRVVFQTDSKFGPGSPGHPEHG